MGPQHRRLRSIGVAQPLSEHVHEVGLNRDLELLGLLHIISEVAVQRGNCSGVDNPSTLGQFHEDFKTKTAERRERPGETSDP